MMSNRENNNNNNNTEEDASQNNSEANPLLTDIQYICKSTSLITEALRNGCDIAQLPNGDIVITEVKTVHTQYSWDGSRQKMARIS